MGSKLGGGSSAQISDYFMSWHIGVCIGPVDEVVEIYFNQKAGSIGGSRTDNGTQNYDNRNLFGGDKSGGGVNGWITYLLGFADQIMPDFLKQKLDDPSRVPSFRNTLSLFFTGTQGGGFRFGSNNAYLPQIAVKVRDYCHVLDDNSIMPNGDVNPAHVIYECMISSDFGKGESPSKMDVASYLAAAQTLRDEGFGISIKWDTQSKIEDFINNILNHINGKHDFNPETGLWTLKLLRGDYDVNQLPVIDESTAVMDNFQRKLYGETINQVIVTWTNPANEQTETVTSQNDATVAIEGAVISDSRDYPGVRNSALAQQLADRDLKIASAPLASGTMIGDRSNWKYGAGDVAKLNFPKDNLIGIIARIVSVDYGNQDSMQISIDWSEDVFAVEYSNFIGVTTSFELNTDAPQVVTAYFLTTAPYFLMVKALGESSALAVDFPEVYAMLLVAPPNAGTYSIDFYTTVVDSVGHASSVFGGTIDPITHDALAAQIVPETFTVLSLVLGNETPGIGDFVVLQDSVNQEIVAVTSILGGVITVRRGCLDTQPLAWPIGTSLWFLTTTSSVFDPLQRMSTTTSDYRFLPTTTLGTLPEASAPTVYDTLNARPFLPLRNSNVSIAGAGFAVPLFHAGGGATLTITWSRRNRLTETSQVLSWADSDVMPEVGQTTTVEFRNASGSLIASYTGITGTSLTVSNFSPFPSGTNVPITVLVYTVRNGFQSFVSVKRIFSLTK